MMKNTLVILIFFFCFSLVKAQISASQQSTVDSIFADWNYPESPGGAVGIIQSGELIYAKGYGSANLEYNIPNSPQTVFRIASTSKQFTAACIILLEQQGELSLNDQLSNFFPDFPSYSNDITVRHLLNHTSGIKDYLGLKRIAGLARNKDYFTDENVNRWITHQQGLNFKPGDQLSYSNSGYWLLGKIVEKVSGVSLAKFAQKHIFAPLQMNNTHFHNDHKHIVKNRAHGYTPNEENGFDIKMYHLDMIGGGGLFTTVEDLKKWDDGFYDSKTLNQDFWNKMTTVGTLNNGEQLNYAAGLGIEIYKGLKVIRHGGAFAGFRAELIRFPEQQFSVIFLANRADVDPSRIAFQIADIFLRETFVNGNPPISRGLSTSPVKNIEGISLSLEQLKQFEGIYWSSQDKISRVLEVRNDTLHYVRSNGRTTKMIPIGRNTFQWLGHGNPIILELENETNIKKFHLKMSANDVSEFTAYDANKSFSTSELEAYTGDYYNIDMDVFYTLRVENDRILIYVNGNNIASIYPIMENILINPEEMNLLLKFNEDQDSFELSIDRINNLIFVKR